MPFTLTMPKLSPTMEEGTIAKWHKKEGDYVEAGSLLLEVATDKATIEHNALDEGFLRKILIPNGGRAFVNQAIAIFTLKQEESIDGYAPEGLKPPATTGSFDDEIKTEPSHVAPTPHSTFVPQGASFIPEQPLSKYDFPFPRGEPQSRIPASPLAKKLAKQKGLDLSTVQGSGPRGRVTSRDLDLAQPDLMVSLSQKGFPECAPGTYEEVPLSPMRQVIAQRLQQAKTFIPHIYIQQEIDAEPLISLREQLKEGGVRVTFNDFCVRSAGLALRMHPVINSGFHSVNQSIILFKTIDISIAVTVDGGLITPIIRHADYKNLKEISVEVKELAARAKKGHLKPEEYKGGSFTISNLGMYGITQFCPIINPPQSSILAIGGIQECVRMKGAQAVLGHKMVLTLATDHRVVDGAEAAQFLKTVQKFLENPSLLLL